MASTSGSPSIAEKHALLIEQFCSVTGSDRDKAYKMLEVCNWNLEMAINMHVDSDFPAQTEPINIEEEVRDPIPQSRAILVEEDLTFQYGLRGRKRRPHSVFDGFRDFQAEARIQGNSVAEESDSNKKRRTLEDLFRPPLDLMHRGTFESARDIGQTSNRWLMVNIQTPYEFSCQVLNRDVWSNPQVKDLVKKYFVFWQVYSDSTDGERYMQFYKPIDFPYIAVIDPRTGEKLVVWHELESQSLCESVDEFLKEFSSPNGISENNPPFVKPSLLDKSEEEQLKAALDASLKDNHLIVEDNESDIETFDSDSNSIMSDKISVVESDRSCDTIDCNESDKERTNSSEDWRNFLGRIDDPNSELVLRLPDGKRVQVTWPSSTKIRALVLYVNELGYNSDKYELLTHYPRRNLSQLDSCQTLKDVDLFPREMIIVQGKI